MEFSDSTNHNIELINGVLESVGASGIFENLDFMLDLDSAGYYSLVAKIATERRSVPLTLIIEGDGIRLDVCGLNEAFEWSKDKILDSRDEVDDFFRKLFTSYILVESCGSANAKSRMFLFDKQGSFIDKYALRGFVQKYSGWDCDKYLFFPVY